MTSDSDEPSAVVQAAPSPQSNLVRLRQLLKERAREMNASRPPQAPPPAPTLIPMAKGSSTVRPTGRIPETELWTMIVQIARSRWERHVKSFLVDQMIAIKYDTLHGMLTSAVREKGLARHIGDVGFDKVLKDHEVRVDYVQPPTGWGTSVAVRCCLFPLSVLQVPPKTLPGPQPGSEVTGPSSSPQKPSSAPGAGSLAPGSQKMPPQFSVEPAPTDGVERMRLALLERANELLRQGRAVEVDCKKAVKVADLCSFYPPWTERDMGQHLRLLDIRTERPWIPTEKEKATVWFAWG